MSEGIQKGKIIEVTNYLTKTHNVHAKIHMPLIINIDQPDNIEPYYTVYNYDRTFLFCMCRRSCSRDLLYRRRKGIKINRQGFFILCFLSLNFSCLPYSQDGRRSHPVSYVPYSPRQLLFFC